MKILHLIYTESISGAEKYLKYLLPGLKGYRIDCDLIIISPKKSAKNFISYCNELNALGVKTTLIQSGRLSAIINAKKISRYLKANKINIIHSHLLNSDIIASLVKSFFFHNLYLISTKHGYQEKVLQQYEPDNYYQPNDLYYHVTKYTLRKIDKNIAVSKGIADLYFNLNLTKSHFPFIHHGINIDDFNKENYRNECRKANPQLIIVGRIELFKGHHFLIEALPLVINEFPQIKLLVLGEGSEKNNRIDQVNKLGLQNNVEFLGFKSHPYSYISHSDVIILPSLFEPFGLVFIEAFALKVPIVAFNTPAGNEIMVNNETALLVDKGDTKALAEKIIYLLNNIEERNQMTERAYTKYKTSFTTEVMVKNTADWYYQNISSKNGL